MKMAIGLSIKVEDALTFSLLDKARIFYQEMISNLLSEVIKLLSEDLNIKKERLRVH